MTQMDMAILVNKVSKRFGRVVALDNISFSVKPGEVFGITGPSGSGKTTLLRCIAALETPDSGSIEVNHTPAAPAGGRSGGRETITLGSCVGMVFQRAYLWPHLTVLENIVLPQAVALKRREAEATKRALELLNQLEIADKKDELPETLSGGQMQRVSIVRMLAMDPSIMLLDEVTTGLDEELIDGLQEIIRGLAHGGGTLVIVAHDRNFLSEIAGRVGTLVDGHMNV